MLKRVASGLLKTYLILESIAFYPNSSTMMFQRIDASVSRLEADLKRIVGSELRRFSEDNINSTEKSKLELEADKLDKKSAELNDRSRLYYLFDPSYFAREIYRLSHRN